MTDLRTLNHGDTATVSGTLFHVAYLMNVAHERYARAKVRVNAYETAYVEFPPDVFTSATIFDGQHVTVEGEVDRLERTPMLRATSVR